MIALLGAVIAGIIYSIAGWKWSWMRSWLICPLLLVAMLLTKHFSLYPFLLCGSFIIGYGYNCPLSKFFRKIGWTNEFHIKFTVRAINGLAIAGSALVLGCIMLWYVPLYIWLGVYNPCKDIKIWKWTLASARVEEFLIGFFAVVVPFWIIWR